jgi:hypothetical protein
VVVVVETGRRRRLKEEREEINVGIREIMAASLRRHLVIETVVLPEESLSA